MNFSVIDEDNFIKNLKVDTPNTNCLEMNKVIKLCKNRLSVISILDKIYEKDNNFKIFGINGINSRYCYGKFYMDGDFEYDYSFVEHAINKNDNELVNYLYDHGANNSCDEYYDLYL